MSARPLMIGNWKMNLTAAAAGAYARALRDRLGRGLPREVVVAPSFTSLPAVAESLRGSEIALAAQNVFWEAEGAYTGEISGVMLQELGVSYVLIGHSERRRHLSETDLMVNHKVHAALRSDLRPVVCVGEQQTERQSGQAAAVVRTQVLRALEGVAQGRADRLTVAYEPIWAIGTGTPATPADASEMHACIRGELRRLFGPAGAAVRILYGGSVGPSNIAALLANPGINGALVGGASLDLEAFAVIAGRPPAAPDPRA
jgi:triosephosphate isomerase (TIM)